VPERLSGWTAEDVAEWDAQRRPLLLRRAVLLAHLAAFAVAVVSDGLRPYVCTAAVPGPCAPEPDFSLALPFLLGAVALLWWAPYAATACSVAFAALDVVFDDLVWANVAFVVAAGIALAHARALHGVCAHQRAVWRRLQRQAGVPVSRPRVSRRAHGPLDSVARLRVLGVVVLVTAAVACVLLYDRAANAEQRHLLRAQRVEATVLGWDDDGGLRLRPAPAAESGLPDVVTVPDAVGEYDTGATVVVLADPQDSSWLRLASEPVDDTWWWTLAVIAVLGAALLGARELRGRTHRGHLAEHEGTGVPVRVVVDAFDAVGLVATDADTVFGEYATGERLRLATDPAEAPRMRVGVLVGDPVDGGWVAVDVDGERLLPEGPLARIVGGTPLELDDAGGWGEDDAFEGFSEATPDPGAVELPWSLPTSPVRLVGGRIGLVAVPLGFVLAAAWLEPGWHGLFWLLGVGGLYWSTLEWAFGRLVATRRGIETCDGLWRQELPWSAVTTIRLDEEHDAVLVGSDHGDLVVEVPEGAGPGVAGAMAAARLDGHSSSDASARQVLHVPGLVCGLLALGVGLLGVVLGFG
jgi:hypothetical protein